MARVMKRMVKGDATLGEIDTLERVTYPSRRPHHLRAG